MSEDLKIRGRLKEDQTIRHPEHETGLTELSTSTVQYPGFPISKP